MKHKGSWLIFGFITISIIIFTFIGMAAAAPWTPPLAIPMPPFGINETTPPPPPKWPGSEASGYYYIDNTNPSATDTSNTYGYPDKPRLTIPRLLSAGSYVEIHGGPYTGGQLIITANGTPDSPVWIRGEGSGNEPVIRRQTIMKGRYIIMEYLKYDANGANLNLRQHGGSTLDHVCVRNCIFAGPGTNNKNGSAISIYSGAAGTHHDFVIWNNKIHDFGDKSPQAPENDYHGIKPTIYAQNVWILNNEIYNMGGDSIQIGDPSLTPDQRPAYIYIGGNTFHDNRENAVDIKRANHVIVSQNTCYGFAKTSSSAGEIIVIHSEPNYVWILFNKLYDGEYGIITTGSINAYFIGNLIYNIRHKSSPWNPNSAYALGAAIHMRNSQTVWVVNNTLWDYDVGIQGPSIAAGHGYHLYNNIIGGRTESAANDIHFPTSVVVNNSQMDYNLLYCPNGTASITWGGDTPRRLKEFKFKFSKGLNCPKESNPMFVSTQNRDFRVQSSSPAYNTGIAHEAYKAFQNLYGINISKDIQGIPRPQGGKWDIGAHEFTTLP